MRCRGRSVLALVAPLPSSVLPDVCSSAWQWRRLKDPEDGASRTRANRIGPSGRVAQWESARFTRERSLVRNQPRPSEKWEIRTHRPFRSR